MRRSDWGPEDECQVSLYRVEGRRAPPETRKLVNLISTCGWGGKGRAEGAIRNGLTRGGCTPCTNPCVDQISRQLSPDAVRSHETISVLREKHSLEHLYPHLQMSLSIDLSLNISLDKCQASSSCSRTTSKNASHSPEVCCQEKFPGSRAIRTCVLSSPI